MTKNDKQELVFGSVILTLLIIGVAIDTSVTEREVTTTTTPSWREAKAVQRACVTDVPAGVKASARVSGPSYGKYTITCTRLRRDT
jgi:hypothetical protein